MKIFIFLFFAMGFCSIIWRGQFSADWFDPENWQGERVPGINDSALIPAGAVLPPYINRTLFIHRLKNDFEINVFDASIIVSHFECSGLISLYRSKLFVLFPFELSGEIFIIESSVFGELTAAKNSFVSGDGHFDYFINYGTIRLIQNHSLSFVKLQQNAKLEYWVGNNIISGNLSLGGEVLVYSPPFNGAAFTGVFENSAKYSLLNRGSLIVKDINGTIFFMIN